MFKRILAVISLAALVFSIFSCSGKTPSGKKYTDKSSNKALAVSTVTQADEKTDALSDIAYTVFYSLKYRDLTGEHTNGVKNAVSVSGNGSDGVSSSVTNTYYGTTAIVSEYYAYKNGAAYCEMYGSGFSATMPYTDFKAFIEKQRYTADRSFFDTKSFSKATSYTLADGGKEIVFKNASAELTTLIAKFIGLHGSEYIYNITNIVMTVNIGADGNLTDKHVTFKASYYEETNPDKVVVYDGDFSYTVDKTADVSVEMPAGHSKAQSISSLNLLTKFTSGYTVLSSFTDIDATYDRFVKNSDYTGSVYEMRDRVHFTEAYRNGKYLYGSIDDRYMLIDGEKSTSAKGMFLGADGKYYARNSDGDEENGVNPPYSDEDFMEMVYSTLSAEMVALDDITKMTVSEDSDTVTFKFAFKDTVIPSYSEYLLAAFSGGGEFGIELDGVMFITSKNESAITIRKHDGCIVSHTVDFAVLFGGTLSVETKFAMTVNATGNSVEVLELSDWGNHSFGE